MNENINWNDYTTLISPLEFQNEILEYWHSDEFNKMFESTIFNDDENCKRAMIHGMAIASMLSVRCKKYLIKKEDL